MDKASQALAQGPPSSVPRSFRAIADHSDVARSTLHARARGRPSLEAKAQSQQYLTPFEEKAMVNFIIQLSDLGTPVRIKYVPSIAFSVARGRPEGKRPLKPPGKNWAKSLENRHSELKAKKVKALDWDRHEKHIFPKIEHWFKVIGEVLKSSDITPENVYNMDETGVMLSKLGSVKVLVGEKDTRDYRGTRNERETVTVVECISADGRSLKPLVIWPARTHRANCTTFPTPGWHYAFSDTGYTNAEISLEWLTNVFDPQTSERANGKPRVLICDGAGTHESLEVLEHCLSHKIILCRLPSHTSHKLQPCDISVFAPLKTAYRDNAERLERGGVNTIGKQHLTSLYSSARDTAFTKRNILAGWSKGGLFPFNPQRVLGDIEKPFARLQEAAGVSSACTVQDTVPTLVAAPVTPVTPVSAGGFMAIQETIIKDDVSTLDDSNRQRVERHLVKLAKAAQISLARGALQEEHIRFLLQINDEARARRDTRSLIVGTARVMSFEDLANARAKRAEQEEKNAARQRDLAEARAKRAKQEETNAARERNLTQARAKRAEQAKQAKVIKSKGTYAPKRNIGAPRPRKAGAKLVPKQVDGEPNKTVNAIQVAQPNYVEGPIPPCPGRAPTARMW